MEMINYAMSLLGAMNDDIRGVLEYLRQGPMNGFFESLWWQIPFYGSLAYDGISHFPQIRRNLIATPEALREAVAPTPLMFNAGLGVVVGFAAIAYEDPILILNGVLLMAVYSTSLAILLVRRSK